MKSKDGGNKRRIEMHRWATKFTVINWYYSLWPRWGDHFCLRYKFKWEKLTNILQQTKRVPTGMVTFKSFTVDLNKIFGTKIRACFAENEIGSAKRNEETELELASSQREGSTADRGLQVVTVDGIQSDLHTPWASRICRVNWSIHIQRIWGQQWRSEACRVAFASLVGYPATRKLKNLTV